MVPAEGPKRYHHGDLREALVAAGLSLLEEKGWRDFTLRECARRASVSHAAPAHHFASLDDLLTELSERGEVKLREAMETEGGRSGPEPAAQLVGRCVGYMAFAAGHPELFELMFHRGAAKSGQPALAPAVEALIPQASPEVKARMVDFAWSTVHGFIVLVLQGRIGGKDSSRRLKSRGLAMLAEMVETVLRAGNAS